MDSHLPQSKSVPLNLSTARRHRVSISTSGSYQSHLTGFGHHHRVRTTTEQIPLRSVHPDKACLRTLEDGLAEQRPRVGRLCLLNQFITDPVTFLLDDLCRMRAGHVWRLRTFLTLYCCFCALFLSLRIHTLFRDVLQIASLLYHQVPDPVHAADVQDELLMNISLSQRLSIAFRQLPPQAHLDTFVLRANLSHTSSNLTACLWIEDVRIEEALASAAAWPGLVSLVVVTTNVPGSAAHTNLISYLASKDASVNASVHLLHVPSIAGGSSNTYLNMARFFAHTSRVILFPDDVPFAMDNVRWLDDLPVDALHPIVLSNVTQKAFSPRPLAPVLVPRDHPVWCTERSYMFGSRALDWEDCVWTLWLESAGEASSIAVTHGLDGFRNTSAVSVPPFALKMRLRWSTKYRSEMCKRSTQAFGPLSKTEKRRIQWRKRFCRETVGSGALES